MSAAIGTSAAGAANTLDAALLSFVAAFVDTSGFIGLFGLFTAHVTGNFVLIGAALVERNGDLVARLLSLPVFVAAIVATVLMANALKRRGRARLAPLLLVEGCLLLLALAVSLGLPAPARVDDTGAIAVGMVLVCAMGLQNALMRIELASLPPTTVMTGTVTQVVIDALILASNRADAPPESSARMRRMLPMIAAFTVGAAGGAAGYAWRGFSCLAVPAVLCLVLAWRMHTKTA